MDTQLLTAFVTVAEESSFSMAAEKLGLTQSAVSKRIALLESQITQPLFDRIGRRVELTEAGTALIPRAKRILQEVYDTQRFMADLRGNVSGDLRIGTSHHIGLHRLPPVLKHFTQQYPEVLLKLQFIDSEQALESILYGEFDLALITLSDAIINDTIDTIQYHSLWQDPMCFVSNKHHPLSQKDCISLADLAIHPAILPDVNTHTTQLIQSLFEQENLSLSLSMTTNHLDAIKMMISVGLGWSVLPETLMTKDLVRLPLNKIRPIRQLGCIFHRERSLSNAARAMLVHLREHNSG
ncbi:MAG: LysR family transcriptional regulator [Pseudomonadota bacterium]